MSSTITIPAKLAAHIRAGLYEHLQSSYENLEQAIVAPDREDPTHAAEQQRLLDHVQQAVDALRATGHTTTTPAPLHLDPGRHQHALLAAIHAACDTENYLTETLPNENPRRQQAQQTIRALTALHHHIQEPQPGGELDPYLERLVILAVLDQDTHGQSAASLERSLHDYPPEDIHDAISQLADLHLILRNTHSVRPAPGLTRLDELGLISI